MTAIRVATATVATSWGDAYEARSEVSDNNYLQIIKYDRLYQERKPLKYGSPELFDLLSSQMEMHDTHHEMLAQHIPSLMRWIKVVKMRKLSIPLRLVGRSVRRRAAYL